MGRKVLNAFWITALVIISFPVGAYFSLGTQGFNLYDYEMKFIAGGVAMILAFGAISFFLFKYLKKTNYPNPAKPAIIVYGILTALFMTITNLFFFEDVAKERMEQVYLEWFEPELTKHISEEFTGSNELKQGRKPKDLSGCICVTLETEEKFLKEIIDNGYTLEEVVRSPKYALIYDECLKMFKIKK